MNDSITDKNIKERIAKVMARAGLCSRRDAEEWIRTGRVILNGTLLDTPAITVGPEDHIVVDGKPLPIQEDVRVWLFHKSRRLITTHKDPEGRPTVFQVLPKDMPRVISVGRLDVNSEGLLLLTNSGELSRFFEHPQTQIPRVYRVRVFGKIDRNLPDRVKNGLTIEGVFYGPMKLTIDDTQGANTWLTLTLYEGKNREIRRIIQHFDLSLNRLIRVSYGPFNLANLAIDTVWEVPPRRLKADLTALGYFQRFEPKI